MHIPLCYNEITNFLSGDKLYHPKNGIVKNVDKSAQYRQRKRHISILYHNQMRLMKSILKYLQSLTCSVALLMQNIKLLS